MNGISIGGLQTRPACERGLVVSVTTPALIVASPVFAEIGDARIGAAAAIFAVSLSATAISRAPLRVG